jgi:hypothetical protein
MAQVQPARVFRVSGATVLLAITAVATAALLIDAAVRSGVGNMLLLAPWLLLLIWTVYVSGIASDIRADPRGVLVQNLLRRTWVPWSRVTRIAMRWQLELTLDDGAVVRCFGGPARSRPRRLGPGRTRDEGADEVEDGIARLQRLRLDAVAAPGDAVARTWDRGALLALVALVVWIAIAVVVAY